jgi:hypothetical protein
LWGIRSEEDRKKVKEENVHRVYDSFLFPNCSILTLGVFNAAICPGYFCIRGQTPVLGSQSDPLRNNGSEASLVPLLENKPHMHETLYAYCSNTETPDNIFL